MLYTAQQDQFFVWQALEHSLLIYFSCVVSFFAMLSFPYVFFFLA